MRYAQIYSIVEGALDREYEATSYELAGEFVRQLAEDAAGDGYETKVYVIMHFHAPDVEDCACAQYETDHHPTWVFPRDGVEDASEYAAYFA